MRLVSRLSLANHSDSGFFLVAHASPSQDGFHWEGSWKDRTYGLVSPIDFWLYPNSSSWWWLLSSRFLIRPSYHKITHANSYSGAWSGGRFSQCFPQQLCVHPKIPIAAPQWDYPLRQFLLFPSFLLWLETSRQWMPHAGFPEFLSNPIRTSKSLSCLGLFPHLGSQG